MAKEIYIRGLNENQMIYLRERIIVFSESKYDTYIMYRNKDGDLGVTSTDADNLFKIIGRKDSRKDYREIRISADGKFNYYTPKQ